jgi:copper oxidase (laccase) domain-containing protein
MTRKDYQLIASVLNKFTAEDGNVVERDAMAYDLADALGADNPRFDRERFLVAAGVWQKCNYCTARATSFSSSLQWCKSHRGEGLLSHRIMGALA